MNEALRQSIEGRELFSLDGHGVIVRGTLHAASRADATTRKRTGIIFLNSLSLPRTATGDSAVFWAECFANLGYPSFRLDLPGLGDSGGTIPAELLNFINAGEYASIAAAKLKELIEDFGLEGVVLVGHCAGTVTAIHAAATCPDIIRGLILLDPYFHLPQAVRPMVRRGLSHWAMRSRFGGVISNIYDRVRDIRRMLRGNALPQNANHTLLSCWKQVASAGVPILLFKAPARKAAGAKPRVGDFDYLSYILQLAGPTSRVRVELVADTDHSFANRAGRTAVACVIARWLPGSVRGAEQESAELSASPSKFGDNNSYNHYQLNCLRS